MQTSQFLYYKCVKTPTSLFSLGDLPGHNRTGAVVGLVEDQAEVVCTLHTAALGLVGNWDTAQEHLEKALHEE